MENKYMLIIVMNIEIKKSVYIIIMSLFAPFIFGSLILSYFDYFDKVSQVLFYKRKCTWDLKLLSYRTWHIILFHPIKLVIGQENLKIRGIMKHYYL